MRFAAAARHAVQDRVEVGARQLRGERKRQQRGPRPRAHRRQIAEIHGQRTVTDRVGRRQSAIEVDAFDAGIDGEHVDVIALRLDHRRIVADADDDPGRRRRQTLLYARDQLAFTELGNGHLA
jgi:hypothetical protein